MTIDLSNQQILLTGASQGIGLATLKQLLGCGASVIATDRDISLLKDATHELQLTSPEKLRLKELDLMRCDHIVSEVPDWIEEVGKIDQLVHCAGILHLNPILTAPTSTITDTFSVNVFGATTLLQQLGQHMKAQRKGNIVVIGSNAANTPRANMGAYAASKAALHMLVKCFGMELAEFGIRCNIVSPGSTRTSMQMQLWNEHYGEQQVIEGNAEQYRLGIPLKKIAEPEDIVQTILFLMSDAANHITLHDLRVDGGATLDN
ncbi:2,3-dihydro-2,3-dihydroxybenzoate dehydrogenase [Vibrio sp.]|nr:2,3-dihydro-2,3-dihydroxybenzoate dehydrogenase [Vibrio sp.]